MFSWCGSSSTHDLVFPTYEVTEASIECMGRQSLDVLAAMGRNRVPWGEKVEKVFWRGRDSRRERLDLVRMAQENPDHINASITAFFFFRDQEAALGRAPYTSFFDFFDHKYQLNIDGTVAAYRLPYLLAGNSVVFKQDSEYYEHFYSALEPWVHFIPVAALNYFDSYRRETLPANLTQAQRDFFGGHTYERTDRSGVFHCAWTDSHKDIGDISERTQGEKLQ